MILLKIEALLNSNRLYLTVYLMIVSFFTTYDELDELYTLRIDLGIVIYRLYINGSLHVPELIKSSDRMTLSCHNWSIHIDPRSVSVKTGDCESNILLSQSTIEMLKYELLQVMNRIYQFDTPCNGLDYLYTQSDGNGDVMNEPASQDVAMNNQPSNQSVHQSGNQYFNNMSS